MPSNRRFTRNSTEEKLVEQVLRSLQETDYSSLRTVCCHVQENTIRLTGSLATFYQVQLALEAVRKVPGVTYIVNEIIVPEH